MRPILRMQLLAAATCAAALTALGCGGGSSNDNNSGGGGGGTSTAQIRTLNTFIPAAGNNGTISVSANGSSLSGSNGVAFGQLSPASGYTAVASGVFTPTGTAQGLANPIQVPTPVAVSGNSFYTLVAAGQAGQNGTTAPQFFLVQNFVPGSMNIPSGDVAIRVINLSPGSNPIGLYTTSNGAPATPVNGGTASLSYGYNGATNQYVIVPVSQLSSLALVDTTNTGTAVTLGPASNLSTFGFTSGNAYTLWVFGQNGNAAQPLTAVWTQDFPTA